MNYSNTNLNELLTINEASNLLKVHPNTLRNWAKEGKLNEVRIGDRKDRRFKIQEILSLTENTDLGENAEVREKYSDNSFQIIYQGKESFEQIIDKSTPAILKLVRVFNQTNDKEYFNSLFYGDNLNILKSLYSNREIKSKIKLIYIDPPYSTKQKFKNKSQSHAYDDLLNGASYIEFIRKRLIFLRELLADDGSVYIHLDENMAFPIKTIMDEVFGEKNYRNWITRKKCNPKNYTSKQYGNIQDFVLFYTKSNNYTWNRPYETQGIYNFEERFPKIDKVTGRRYALVPIHAKGTRNGATGGLWKGMNPPEGKHWQFTPDKLDEFERQGRIYWSPNGNPRRIIYADEDKGVPVQDIWLSFKDAHNQNIKVTGYPTEKNPDMLNRIIKTSSNEGDIVLDCFSGSGTTLAVAEELGRRWIGMDSSELAIKTTIKRLTNLCKSRAETSRKKSLALFEEEIKECEPFGLLATSGIDISVD